MNKALKEVGIYMSFLEGILRKTSSAPWWFSVNKNDGIKTLLALYAKQCKIRKRKLKNLTI